MTVDKAWLMIKDFFNSAFTVAVIGSLLGAWGGATAAQKIAGVSKLRDELVLELRNTNAAMSIAFSICNSFLGLKKQHVAPMHASYVAQSALHSEFMRAFAEGRVTKDTVFKFAADFRTLQSSVQPIDLLQTLMIERLSLVGRPLNLITTLNQTIVGLAQSIERRNQLLEGYKRLNAQTEMPILYFGLVYDGGHQDVNYPETLTAIARQTDDAIYFSRLICEDLHLHGTQLLEKFAAECKGPLPRLTEVDFTPAEANDTMPAAENYTQWTTAFVRRPDPLPSKNWLRRIVDRRKPK